MAISRSQMRQQVSKPGMKKIKKVAGALRKASKNWEACGSQQDVIKVLFFCIKVLKDGFAKDIREGLLSKFRDIITHGGNKKKEVKEKYFSFIEEHLLK